MKIKVSSKNEYKFHPFIGEENEALPIDKQFTVVLRRMSSIIHSGEWADVNSDTGRVNVDIIRRVGAHIVRLENAPELENEDGKAWKMTVEDLLSGKHPELYEIVRQINSEINIIDDTERIEIKNS